MLRALIVAFVIGASMTNPTFALRTGAALCGLVVISALGTWRPSSIDRWMLVLAALAYWSRSWSLSLEDTLLISTNYLGFAAVFLGVRVAVVDARTLQLVARGFVAGCAYAAYHVITASGTALLRFEFDVTAARVGLNSETGASANYLAYGFAACVAVLVMLSAVKPFSKIEWVLAGVVAAMMWLGIVAAGTRGALIGVGLTVGWVILQKWIARGQAAIGLGVAYVCTSLLLASGQFDRLLASRVERSVRDTGTLNGRLDVWPLAREQFSEHPMLGIGVGAFRRLNSSAIPAHNAILDVATGLGLVGLVVVALILWRAFVTETAALERSVRILVVGAIVLATAPALMSGYWVESPTFWAVVGLTSALARGALSSARVEPGLSDRARRPRVTPRRAPARSRSL